MSYGYGYDSHPYDSHYDSDYEHDHHYYDDDYHHDDAAVYAPAAPTIAATVSNATCGYNCGVFLVHMDTMNVNGFVCDACHNGYGAGVPSHHCTNCNVYDLCEGCAAYYFPTGAPAPAPALPAKPPVVPPPKKKLDFKASPFWTIKAKVNTNSAAKPACFLSHYDQKIRMTIPVAGKHECSWKITPNATNNTVTIAHFKEPRFLSYDKADGKLKLAPVPAGQQPQQFEFFEQKDNTYAIWAYSDAPAAAPTGPKQGAFIKSTGKILNNEDHALANGTEKDGETTPCQFIVTGQTTVPGCCLVL